MTIILLYNNNVSTIIMGRSYKQNDLYSSNRAKSLREKRKQSKTKYRRENDKNSTTYVENYQQPRKDYPHPA